MMVIIFLKTRDLETPQEYLRRQRIMAKWRGRKRREGKKITKSRGDIVHQTWPADMFSLACTLFYDVICCQYLKNQNISPKDPDF